MEWTVRSFCGIPQVCVVEKWLQFDSEVLDNEFIYYLEITNEPCFLNSQVQNINLYLISSVFAHYAVHWWN